MHITKIIFICSHWSCCQFMTNRKIEINKIARKRWIHTEHLFTLISDLSVTVVSKIKAIKTISNNSYPTTIVWSWIAYTNDHQLSAHHFPIRLILSNHTRDNGKLLTTRICINALVLLKLKLSHCGAIKYFIIMKVQLWTWKACRPLLCWCNGNY